MSHVSTIDVDVKDLNAVRRMCEREGWEFRENQKTYGWYGQSVGDYPIPEGVSVEDLGKCDHAIHIPGCDYEVGLIHKQGSHYTVIADLWSGGGLEKHVGEDCGRIKQLYALEKAKIEAKKKGYLCREQAAKDGSIILTVGVS